VGEETEDERDKQLEEARLQTQGDAQAVLSTPAGRRFVWRLIDSVARVHGASFCGESTHATAYQEGRRAVGIELLAELQRVAPAAYLLMVEEAMAALRERTPTA
jgi:hypothetical protein